MKKSTLKNLAAIGILSLSTITGIEIYKRSNWTKNQLEMFGTVDSPKYSITATFPEEDENSQRIRNFFMPIQEVLDKSSKEISDLERILSSIKEKSRETNDRLEQIDKSPKKEDFTNELRELQLRSLDIYLRKIDVSIMNIKLSEREFKKRIQSLEISNLRDYESKNPELLMEETFKDLTGKKFPKTIIYKREEQEGGLLGYHSPLQGIISYKGLKTIESAIVLLHEAGHLIAQHGEEQLILRSSTDVSALEEACAYAFTNAGIEKIRTKDEDLGLIMRMLFEGSMEYFANKHYQLGDLEEHALGAAYFIATRAAYKDPVKTFKTLSTTRGSSLANLPDEVTTSFEKIKTRQRDYANNLERKQRLIEELGEVFKSFREYEKRASEILEGIEYLNTPIIDWSEKVEDN